MKTKFAFLICLLVIVSCSENEDLPGENRVYSSVQEEIRIKSSDTLKIDLGNFGDEEGAWIFENPKNAKVNRLVRELSVSTIFYEYSPLDNFLGRDTVALILNRGSDGASPGINDTARICIITEQ